jgi:hypothetical protein
MARSEFQGRTGKYDLAGEADKSELTNPKRCGLRFIGNLNTPAVALIAGVESLQPYNTNDR